MVSSISRHLALAARALLLAPAAAARERPQPACRACLLVADDGTVLFERAADRPLPNASTTKIATALVVVAHAALGERVTVSAAAAATGGGGLALEAGDVYSVRALLHALLLSSSNDAAALLAEPVLAAIVAKARATVAGPDGPLVLINRNPLLETFVGADGVKTGYTRAAGNVLVASAERARRRLIAAVMGSVDAAKDAAALLSYGFARLARGVLLARGAPLGSVIVDPAGAVTLVAGRAVRGSARPEGVTWRLRAGTVELPVRPGARLGTVVVEAYGRIVGRAPALAAGRLEAAGDGAAAHLLLALLGALGALLGGGVGP